MLMGAVCTRACRFCAVDTGNPRGWLDSEEPANSARTVQLMRLKYVVLTSVNRDDLDDGGASHFAACVREIKRLNPGTAVEALTPDFQGVLADVETVVAQRPGRVRAERRDGAAPDASGARSARRLRADAAACSRTRSVPSRRADEDQSDAGPRRDRRRDRRDDGRHPRGRRRHSHARPVSAPDAESSGRSSAGSRRRSSTAIANGRSRKASSNASPGRWCARAIAPSARSNATTPACEAADSGWRIDRHSSVSLMSTHAARGLRLPLTAIRPFRCCAGSAAPSTSRRGARCRRSPISATPRRPMRSGFSSIRPSSRSA